MLRAVMHPEMVYQFPIWAVGASLGAAAVCFAVVLELIVGRFVPPATRREHNDIGAAIFSIIGVTYAVLLAFVAMLAWDGFNKAEVASHQEAAISLDVDRVAAGLPEPARGNLRGDLIGYARAVITKEFPAQAAGTVLRPGDAFLDRMNAEALALHPADRAQSNLHALLLERLTRLHDAREDRLLSAMTGIPGIVWFVLVLGGALTIGFGSCLGASSVRLHLTMSALLALSGVLVMVMIIALSNPFRGDFRVSTEPYEAALGRMMATR